MGTQCPCGCGKSVSRLLKGTAERAIFVDSLTALPLRLAENHRVSNPKQAELLEGFARKGRYMSENMLGAAHRESWATVPPSAKAVGDWESAALKLMRDVQLNDPEWFKSWPGAIRNRVTGKGGH